MVALAAGLVLGLINGLLMKLTRGGSGEGFMITLATGMMAQALAKWYCAGSEIIRIDLPAEIDWFKQLGQGNLLGFPICTMIWIAVMVILQIVIKKTTFGRQMLLTGANKKSAFLAGINVNRVKVIAYTVAGFCCGIAAVIYAARFTSASDGAGVGGDFNGAVCSIIGGNALYGGHGGMVQVFIGTVTFGLISNILQLFGLSTAVQYIVQRDHVAGQQKTFFTPYNIFTIADSISGYGIVALGFTFILLVGQLDISFGSVIALSACIFMMMLQAEMNFLLALLAAIAVGCACGAVTGFFVATFRLSPFIVSMTMQLAYKGIALTITNQTPVSVPHPRAAGDQQYQAVQHFPDRIFLLPAAGGADRAVSAQYAVRP